MARSVRVESKAALQKSSGNDEENIEDIEHDDKEPNEVHRPQVIEAQMLCSGA